VSSTRDDERVATVRSGQHLDRLALLEEERRFLLRSLRDLEAEHDAGDVDDVDYVTLRDGYTVRAATVLRQIAEGREQLAPKKPRRWGQAVAIGVAVAVGAVGIGLALASAWGEREPGQNVTGATPGELTGERDSDVARVGLAQARAAMSGGDFATANRLFYEVDLAETERGVENVEARTYLGWTTALRARALSDPAEAEQSYEVALLALQQAIAIDPEYGDPYCFAGIIEYNFRDDAKAALPYIEQCQALDPPADVESIVDAFADEIRSAADT
jgi:tetratricopeptide (TPR) repeat protein